MKLEQQLRQLSFSGLAAALLLMVVPQQAFAMHIMEGFLPPVWALAWWLLFLPCLWYGLVRLRRIVQEDNHQKVLLALCGAFIFVLSALKIPSVTGSCSHPTACWSGGYLVRARGGGDSRCGCAVVSGAIAGARRPDDAWRKWNVDGGDWPGCRLSGVENGLPCRTAPRCRRFSVRDAGGFGDLFCDFSPAWRCVSRSPCRSDRVCCEVYGDFLPHTDSCRHCRRFINRHDL